MKESRVKIGAAVIVAVSALACAGQDGSGEVYTEMPVKEVTVFKDGHAFVLHSGKVDLDKEGRAKMDRLPAPVIGTFWPYSADKSVKLKAVKSSRCRTKVERTAMNMQELIEANTGADVVVTEIGDKVYDATILGRPFQSAEEIESKNPDHSHDAALLKSDVVLLSTTNGTRVVALNGIKNITFKGKHKGSLVNEEYRNSMSLEFDWQGKRPAKQIEAGMVYLQRGIRWIPGYKVVIDGKGKANLKLNATVVNELVDVDDITMNLVIGVPSFAFKESVDPISMQKAVAQLSQSFQVDNQTAYAFSNAIMTQHVAPVYQASRPSVSSGGTMDLGPDVTGSGKSEDLYVFTVKNISLKKGERMVIPVAEFELEYRDVYTLDIPFTPPPEVWQNLGHSQINEVAKLFHAPKVMHNIRLRNSSKYPLTTAPALIMKEDKVIAQGMMTYTAIGSESDLELTVAVNVEVKKKDRETERKPNAINWNGNTYARIDLNGTITLTSFADDDIEVEISRHVLGAVDQAGQSGRIEMVNVFEDSSFTAGRYPAWWGWYSWPYWWYHLNSVGRISWTAKLEPDKAMEFQYSWHYYWR